MIYMTVILIIVITYLLARLFYIKNQVKSIKKQLIDINQDKVDKKVTVELLSKDIEELTTEINRNIDIKKECIASKVKFENNLRQTVANISHDLRTPLTSIIGYIQFIKLEDLKEDEKKQYINIALERAKYLEGLLNDFYELSLIDSLDFKLKMEKVNVSRILQEVLVEKYMDFKNRNINPQINIPKENIYIVADKKSVERILENLLSNATKYSKDEIEISLKVENNLVKLKIKNNFLNLTVQDVENIFDRFYMADKSRIQKGTGLGLCIAKGLVDKMNGNMEAKIINDKLNICCSFKKMIEFK